MSPALAQSWTQVYSQGLSAASSGQWTASRAAFLQAVALRPEDTDSPTILPGPPKVKIQWRNGAPYSPNFLAAYAGYRSAIQNNLAASSTSALRAVGIEFQTLLAKGQTSLEAKYFLSEIYRRLGDETSRRSLKAQPLSTRWLVDTEPLSRTEKSAVVDLGKVATLRPATPTAQAAPITLTANLGPVPLVGTKFALLIGNSVGRLGDLNVPFSGDDVQAVRDALVQNGGYPAENIEVVLNGTAAQIAGTARALSDRVTESGTVLIYFSGVGANIDGHDFLAGVDTTSSTDTPSMLAKQDLYRPFMAKGARIFGFYQVNRPTVLGRFFGSEIPSFGSIAQVQATLPGDQVGATIKGGRSVGLFTQAFISVLGELRSGQIPIQEFGWQLFYRIRRGDTGTTGGSSRQTPTLPMLSNLAADARF